jgi:hypothetical protein
MSTKSSNNALLVCITGISIRGEIFNIIPRIPHADSLWQFPRGTEYSSAFIRHKRKGVQLNFVNIVSSS